MFVSHAAAGLAPVSDLVTGSFVQDGNGMLPLLVHSRKDFPGVKAVTQSLGLAVGRAMLVLAGRAWRLL